MWVGTRQEPVVRKSSVGREKEVASLAHSLARPRLLSWDHTTSTRLDSTCTSLPTPAPTSPALHPPPRPIHLSLSLCLPSRTPNHDLGPPLRNVSPGPLDGLLCSAVRFPRESSRATRCVGREHSLTKGGEGFGHLLGGAEASEGRKRRDERG